MTRSTATHSEKANANKLPYGLDINATVTAAWLYYHHNLTQAEIATLLDVSRPAVANLLSRARDEGLVTISVRPDLLSRLSLADEIRQRFSLENAYVVPTPPEASDVEIRQAIGKAAALLLESTMQPGEVLATAWGATALEVANALSGKKIEGTVLAQAIGCLNSGESINPIRLASVMGEKLGARVYHLPLPAIVSSVEVKEILLADRNIRACLDMARSASRAMIGIGVVAHGATAVTAGFFDRIMMDELRAKGAVGDISCRYFDVYGRPVITESDRRIVSLTFDDMRSINPVIAAAGGGEDKVVAILGALRTGCINILIIDERTAARVLALDKEKPIPAEIASQA